jgi:D-alanyl-D-alanine carboxypeptidase
VSAIAGYIHKNDGQIFVVICMINSPSVSNGVGQNFENSFFDWTANNL